jgi:hypothetical protein
LSSESPLDEKAARRVNDGPATSTTTETDYATDGTFSLWQQAAAIALDAWAPALDRWYTIGFETGYVEGYRQGANEYGDRIDRWLGIARSGLDAPTQAELAKARALSHEPCRTKCARCSQCVHSQAWYRRGRRDYLGVEAEAALAGAA